jgi:tRNA threonylcarbamoyl adenosine modification protein YjeE
MGLTMPDDPPVVLERTVAVADEAATRQLAAALAAVLPRPCLVTLEGDLGAGKTTFVKGVAAAVGIDPDTVISPTFGLIHEHSLTPGGPRLVHADMYRLAGLEELVETGWDDACSGEPWVFVEWPERIAAALPAERIELLITIDAPERRTFTFRGKGAAQAAAVQGIGGESPAPGPE